MSASGNFIDFDPKKPADVFSKDEIDFALNLPASLSEEDRKRVFSLEEIRFNKTTRVSHFDVIPGLRPQPNQVCIYFSRFRQRHYNKIVDKFFEYPLEKLPEGQEYNAVCRAYRTLLPDGQIFYPVEFTGNIHLAEIIYRKSANILGASLARFIEGKFDAIDDDQCYLFQEIRVGKAKGRAFPKNW